MELKHKRQVEEISRQDEEIKLIEQTKYAIAEIFKKVDDTESFQHWVNNCIANSSNIILIIEKARHFCLAKKEILF